MLWPATVCVCVMCCVSLPLHMRKDGLSTSDHMTQSNSLAHHQEASGHISIQHSHEHIQVVNFVLSVQLTEILSPYSVWIDDWRRRDASLTQLTPEIVNQEEKYHPSICECKMHSQSSHQVYEWMMGKFLPRKHSLRYVISFASQKEKTMSNDLHEITGEKKILSLDCLSHKM